MTYKLSNVRFETKKHAILDCGEKGFEVYEKDSCAMTRKAVIGYSGKRGLRRAISEVMKREEKSHPNS